MNYLIEKEEFIDDDGIKQTFYYYKEDITDEDIEKLHPRIVYDTSVGVKYKDGYTLVYYCGGEEEEV